jgi:iron complex transport system substrate-binding protein
MRCRLMAMIVLFIISSRAAISADIIDMKGREVPIPDTIKKLYAPSPYGAFMMYALAPDLMSGLIFQPSEEDGKFLNKNLQGLPVIGSLSGEAQAANLEVLLRAKPDVLIVWSGKDTQVSEKMQKTMDTLNIPYVYVVVDTMADYPDAIRFLGRLLKREERAEKLAQYCAKTLQIVNAAVTGIPAAQKPRVYYAEGTDGLSTECNDSIHVELMRLAGDVDVHRCHTASHMGLEKISLEQVMLYNPDVIVAQERLFYDKVYNEPAWKQIKAVKEKKVFLIPRTPFNWFDRPPSVMRFLGLQWLVNRLYPEEYKIDIKKEARNFYSLFLGVDLSERDLNEVMVP